MAIVYPVFPGGRRKALTLSYDDGVEQDARLLEIMAKHGLKGTFNLNSGLYAPEGTIWPQGHIHRRLSKSAVTRLYAQSGQEVAIHCAEHGNLPLMPAAAAIQDVMRDKDALEQQFGRIIRGMAYPYGRVSPELARLLEGCGIAYSRTTVSTEKFSLPEDWLQWPATCHHKNPRLMDLARSFAENMTSHFAQLFYLWGHSYEFEADDNWHVIEEFSAYIGGREDIWYATNIEIHDYLTAWRNVHTSADGKRLFNPSCIPLWVSRNDQITQLPPGQEIVLP